MTDAVLATSYGGPEVLEVRDVEVPSPRNGQVTIDVRAAGVNPFDYKVYSGTVGSDESRLPMPLGLGGLGRRHRRRGGRDRSCRARGGRRRGDRLSRSPAGTPAA